MPLFVLLPESLILLRGSVVRQHLLLNIPIHSADLSFNLSELLDLGVEEPGSVVAHCLLIFITR